MVVLQTTGGAIHAPGAGRAAAARAHPSLLALGPRSVSHSVQRVHQALGGQGHTALVALQWFVVTVVSSGEIGTGLCTSTSRPVGGTSCSDNERMRSNQWTKTAAELAFEVL